MPGADDDGRSKGLLVFLHGHGSAASGLADLNDRLDLAHDGPWSFRPAPVESLDDPGSWFENGPVGVDSRSLDASAEHLETAVGVLLDRGGFERT